MGMANPHPQTYVIWSINGVDVHREPLTTFDLGPIRNKLAILFGARDLINVRYETVTPADFRTRAERRGQKNKRRHGPQQKQWWNNR